MISVLDVEEEEGAGHQHAQDGDGGQDAVERHVDVAPLQTHKCPVLGWLHPCGRKQEVRFGFPQLLYSDCKNLLRDRGCVDKYRSTFQGALENYRHSLLEVKVKCDLKMLNGFYLILSLHC